MQSEDHAVAAENDLSIFEEVALNAAAVWGLRPKSLSLIKHRENAVYKLLTEDDRLFALRVHREGYHSDEALKSEFVWMQALGEAGINVPEFLRYDGTEIFASVSHEKLASPRQVDLLHWIDGDQLGSVEEGLGENTEQISHIYSIIGETMARLHAHSSAWLPPPNFVRHSWDLAGLLGEAPFWGRFWELQSLSSAQRNRIISARDSAVAELSLVSKAPSQFGMIHADLVPENILLEDGQIRIIDFDDAGFGWYLFDIATALYFIQDDPNFDYAKSALIGAYQEVRPLPQEDLDRLPLFMLVRSFTYLGWVHTRTGSQEAEELTPVLIEMCLAAVTRYESYLG
jgi:Ser/Thr protein kinase RdoA (MazF antagonist)